MRQCDEHSKTAASKQSMPFDGLGFCTETVSLAADAMTVIHPVGMGFTIIPPVCDAVPQLSGYSLLVSLGREIRGR